MNEPTSKDPKDPQAGESPTGLNSPEVDAKTLKPTKRAIESYGQAYKIAKRLYDKANEGDGRIKKGAVVSRKYGGETPYKNADLRATGQAWRNNFSTNPLASVVDRSKPQLTDPLRNAPTLTYSRLSTVHDDADAKTKKFRTATTKLIRAWDAHDDFIDTVSGETYLYGNDVALRLDDDWRPIALKYDEAFLPEGAGQHASHVQTVVALRPVMLHKFMELLGNVEAAKSAGYDIEGCQKAINGAAGLRDRGENTAMQEADAEREGATINSDHEGDSKVIWLFYTIVREYAGGVNIWITERDKGHPIRFQAKVAENMEDMVALFTLQNGNDKFYGSKGAGRMLTNLHIAIDRTRNMAVDQIYLSGLPIVQTDEKDIPNFQAHVRHPFLVTNKNVVISEERVQFDHEAYDWVDNKLVAQMEAIAGAFIPPKIQEGATPNTKIEAAQKAEREMAVRSNVLGRHIRQHGDCISMMQRSIYSTNNLKEAWRIFEETEKKKQSGVRVIARKVWDWIKGIVSHKPGEPPPEAEPETKTADPEAVECILSLLRDGLSIEEIAELALCPANSTAKEMAEEDKDRTTAFLQAKVGDPYYDQRKLARKQATDELGKETADDLLLKEQEDPNEEAAAIRMQLIEWSEIMAGEEMPVASLDLHRVHKKVIAPRLEPIIKTLMMAPGPELIEPAKLGLTHLANHVMMDDSVPMEQKKQEQMQIEEWKKIIEQAEKTVQQMAEQAQQAQIEAGASGMPSPVNGAPLQAGGPEGSLEPYNPEKDKLMSAAVLKNRELDLKQAQLELEERKLNQADEHFTMGQMTSSMQHVADTAAQAYREGATSAEADLRAEQAAEEAKKSNPPKSS